MYRSITSLAIDLFLIFLVIELVFHLCVVFLLKACRVALINDLLDFLVCFIRFAH